MDPLAALCDAVPDAIAPAVVPVSDAVVPVVVPVVDPPPYAPELPLDPLRNCACVNTKRVVSAAAVDGDDPVVAAGFVSPALAVFEPLTWPPRSRHPTTVTLFAELLDDAVFVADDPLCA